MNCDDIKEKNETNRTMLQIYHERSNQLANMLIALNGFMLAFIAGLLTFVGSTYFSAPACVINCPSCAATCTPYNSQGAWGVIIAINIAIIMMILWRFYAHYIDADIVQGYRKIIILEFELKIPFEKSLHEASLQYSLEKLLETKLIRSIFYNKLQTDISFDDRIKIMKKTLIQLIDDNKIGDRGQFAIDKIALISVSLFWILSLIFLPLSACEKNLFIVIPVVTIIVLLSILYWLNKPQIEAYIYRNPEIDYLNQVLKKAIDDMSQKENRNFVSKET